MLASLRTADSLDPNPCLRGNDRTSHAPDPARPHPRVGRLRAGPVRTGSLPLIDFSSVRDGGARPPYDLDLRLAHHPQKRSARCFVDGACKRLRRRVPIEVRGAPGLPFRTLPSGVTRRFRVHPWSVEPLDFQGIELSAIGLAGSTFCEAFLFERLVRLRCVPRSSVTESGLAGPFPKVDPEHSPRLPRSTPRLSPRWRLAGLACSLRPARLTSRPAVLSHALPNALPLLSPTLPHEHDLNASELRSARRCPLVGDTEEPRRRGPRTEPPCERLRGEPRRRPVSDFRASRGRLPASWGGSFDPSTPCRPCCTDPGRRPRRTRAPSSRAGT